MMVKLGVECRRVGLRAMLGTTMPQSEGLGRGGRKDRGHNIGFGGTTPKPAPTPTSRHYIVPINTRPS